MINASLIGHAPAWELTAIHYVSKALGVLVKVEGIPFGSNRNINRGRPSGATLSA